MSVKRRGVRLTIVNLLVLAVLSGCASSNTSDTTVLAESSASESATTEAPDTASPDTEAPDTASSAEALSTDASTAQRPTSDTSTSDASTGDASTSDASASEAIGTEPEAVIPRLADDDPTCVALDRVRKLNDQSGALSNDFMGKAIGAIDDRDASKLEVEFGKYLSEFVTLTEKILPDLKGSYADLAKLQPQFATDLDKLESVTLDLIGAFKKMKAVDLDNMEEFLAAQVSNDDMIAGGLAALKIDKFSRAACDIPFANT